MATTYLGLLSGTATGDALSAANVNKLTGAVDRNGAMMYGLFSGGRVTGWTLTSGAATVVSGTGQVGACWCVTTGSQSVSNLTSGTNYVFAKTDAGSPASGTVDFVARTTSAAIANADGVSNAVLLGKGTYNTTSGFIAVDATMRTDWQLDHGALGGLTDDDHSQYMQDATLALHPRDVQLPGTSAAATSTFGTNFATLDVKFPALSTTRAGWQVYIPSDYSGTVTLYTDWASSGLGGNVHLRIAQRCPGTAATWDAAPTSALAAGVKAIGGTNGHLRRLSHVWSAGLTAGNLATIVIRRDGANASDTMSGTARLIGAALKLNTAL